MDEDFPFFNFTIQGWLQGCTVMLHFLSWHFIVFLFEVKLWFFFFLSYFFCWPDCIPACLGSVLSVMHAALSCREMMMANFNWHIPHLQQFAPLDVVRISSREVWNALRWEDRVHQLASPVNHWSSHHNAVFHWETFGPAIHILPWDTAQLTMAVALPDHYSHSCCAGVRVWL